MNWIEDETALGRVYPDPPGGAALSKVATRLTPVYRRWIEASRFCILTTVGPEGTDASPRGDDGPVVLPLDAHRLALPDWRGNNRIDSLRNIVRDGRASLLFMVRGSQNVVRANGRARITADPEMTRRFERQGRLPRSVLVFDLAEVYFQCAKAVMRADLWAGPGDPAPSAGEMIRGAVEGFDAEGYDASYPEKARAGLW